MLYEILKTSKLGASFAPDMYTALWAQKLARDGEVKTLSGIPPLTFRSNGQPLLDYLISGNTVQNGTPTPDSQIMPEGCGDLETVGEKAGQYKIPISSANTITPVYLGEVRSTRRIKKLVLTGEENYNLQSINTYGIANFYYYLGTSVQAAICTHLKRQATIISQTTDEGYLLTTPSQPGQLATFYMRISSSKASTVAELKSYLAAQYAAGTPVTVWYVLANEETGIVNEPLMRIGDYADTVSYEQAGVEIPTARGTNTIDVLTDVKPSEIYIKYKS